MVISSASSDKSYPAEFRDLLNCFPDFQHSRNENEPHIPVQDQFESYGDLLKNPAKFHKLLLHIFGHELRPTPSDHVESSDSMFKGLIKIIDDIKHSEFCGYQLKVLMLWMLEAMASLKYFGEDITTLDARTIEITVEDKDDDLFPVGPEYKMDSHYETNSNGIKRRRLSLSNFDGQPTSLHDKSKQIPGEWMDSSVSSSAGGDKPANSFSPESLSFQVSRPFPSKEDSQPRFSKTTRSTWESVYTPRIVIINRRLVYSLSQKNKK